MINIHEMKEFESDLLRCYESFLLLRHRNPVAVSPSSFHEEVILKIQELLAKAKNMESEASLRSF